MLAKLKYECFEKQDETDDLMGQENVEFYCRNQNNPHLNFGCFAC